MDTARESSGASLSIAGLLEFEEIKAAEPAVLAGEAGLGRAIRWVHIADSEHVERFLEGGELVLTTATAFRHSPEAMTEFLDQLERAGAAGTIIELVDENSTHDEEAREIAAAAASARELPVIVLPRRVKFVRITELAHRSLLAQQISRLEHAREIHETYTQLSLDRAEAQTIVVRTAELLGTAVVLEDVSHRVLAHSGRGSQDLAQKWVDLVSGASTTPGGHAPSQWRQTPVGLRSRRWGRLVVPGGAESVADLEQVIERAGEALTLTRMADRDEQDLLLQAQSGLIREITDSEGIDERSARERARSLGFTPAEGAELTPVVVRIDREADTDPTRVQLQERGLTQEISSAASRLNLGLLMTSLQSGVFGFVLGPGRGRTGGPQRRRTPVAGAESEQAGTTLANPRGTDDADDRLNRLLAELEGLSASWVVGVGRSSTSLLRAVAGLEAASHVAEVASTLDVRERSFYRSSDVRIRGLLSLLAEDSRLRAFAEGELGPLLGETSGGGRRDADLRSPTDSADEELLDFLELYLTHGGNKSAMARAGHLSRPALYARTTRLQDRLGVSLDDAESRTALHVALLWWRMYG
ncbi:PucR family transcriptional regulator [Brevibacterium permense]|uniref:PucR family transcriptional regulator n=1 Tax=Brevibacterium permense TaxID=234834 RepID=UPI0021D0DACD|nr:PucR family transcriptional regulator [Brevibacterium permense]MCU4295503.1 PucR family transcriptional regulator [Brevibacterium permense]